MPETLEDIMCLSTLFTLRNVLTTHSRRGSFPYTMQKREVLFVVAHPHLYWYLWILKNLLNWHDLEIKV